MVAVAAGKKITLATIKSFIKNNHKSLMISVLSEFDGMVDGCRSCKGGFTPAVDAERNISNSLGIQGAWFVLGGRDYFSLFESESHVGYAVYNCCGSFNLAVAK